jgi:hypothetical protein
MADVRAKAAERAAEHAQTQTSSRLKSKPTVGEHADELRIAEVDRIALAKALKFS